MITIFQSKKSYDFFQNAVRCWQEEHLRPLRGNSFALLKISDFVPAENFIQFYSTPGQNVILEVVLSFSKNCCELDYGILSRTFVRVLLSASYRGLPLKNLSKRDK